MSRILMPLPRFDFDPTESGVPWLELTRRGHDVVFATPDGKIPQADRRMLRGEGLGPWRALLMADSNGRSAYESMAESAAFAGPLAYDQVRIEDFDAMLLPGGHAPGMREYLESTCLQALVAAAFTNSLIVGAICHGVVLAARSRLPSGHSVLYGRRTTSLTKTLELTAWALTTLWLGTYYRTYRTTVQDEVTATLVKPADFDGGPVAILRDTPNNIERGFVIRDGNYLSARWPGDAHRFAHVFSAMLEEHRPSGPTQDGLPTKA